MRWPPWKKKPVDHSHDEELAEAKIKAEELHKRTRKILRENNLGADIKRALGGGYR
jgi:hypothetical protein